MTLLSVPPLDDPPYPSLGGQVCDFIEERAVFGPGSLKGQPAKLDDEKRAIIWRAYEVFPKGHRRAGRRRFQRVGISLPKGSSKTELLAWVAFAELHAEGPVRFDGWDANGQPVGRPVADPYIPLVGVSEEQTEELAYGALVIVCTEGPDADLFDVSLERIIRLGPNGRADGKATALAAAPNSRDGARTTFEGWDEPLALDTPVPTTAGWKSIGEIAPGDFVFGRDGAALRVVGVSPVHRDRSCYRVTFRDGTSVITDASHRWKVIDWSNPRGGERVVTTEQMLARGVETGYGYRWRLPRPAGIAGVQADLPIDPYLLGLWLGDGATNAGYIHSDIADYHALSHGIDNTVSRDTRPGVVRWLPKGLRAQLRALGVLGNKHIPDAYLFASREQRIELLRGLMDTDGHAGSNGAATFVQGRRRLAEDVLLLVRSLGERGMLRSQRDVRSRTGEMLKVAFSPSFSPFRLQRKVDRFAWGPRKSTWWPAVEAIESVESVPVRCIAVEGDDHLFVFGEGFNLTHNTHRLYLPRVRDARATMLANLTKRPLDEPWDMAVTTAGQLGQGSIAEDMHAEAEAIVRGEYLDPDLYYHHRQAGDGYELATLGGRTAAVAEARGGVGEYAPGQFEDIARMWDRPKADKPYLERVWLNRWVRADAQAFDVKAWQANLRPAVADGELVVAGFDGARFRDSTAIVLTDVASGAQWIHAIWERPLDLPEDAGWEIPAQQVDQAVDEVFARYQCWAFWGDPPHWVDSFANWAARHPDQGAKGSGVAEWWTNRTKAMAYAVRDYVEAIGSGEVGPAAMEPERVERLARHVAGAGRNPVNYWHDDGSQLFILRKLHPYRKFDAAMAAVISWQARLEAVRKGARKRVRSMPTRIR